MRRLVGLIALLVLILGAAWLTQNDFDLRRIAGIKHLFEPMPQADATKASADDVAEQASSTDSAVSTASAGDESEAASATPEPGSETDTGGAPEPATTAGSPSVIAEAGADAKSGEAEMAADSDAPVAETEISMADPSADAETGLEAAPPLGDIPSFDIVRVEPTGETVIAGLAAPEAMVEVLNGADPIATAEANERGEWALVLDVPLPPGDHDLAIRTTSPDRSEMTMSDQRVAVSIPEGADEEPLVVLLAPGGASRVMQIPDTDETADEPQVAAVPEGGAMSQAPSAGADVGTSSVTNSESAATSSPAEAMGTEGQTAAMAEQDKISEPMASSSAETEVAAAPSAGGTGTASVSSGSAAPVETPPAVDNFVAASPESPMADSSGSAGDAETAATSTASPADRASQATDMAAAPPSSSEGDTMAAAPPAGSSDTPFLMDGSASDTPPSSEASASSGTETAVVAPTGEPAPAAVETAPPAGAEAPAPVVPEVGVAAVEAETNGAFYIAGTATTSEPVRVYVDDEFVGEATPSEGGTWLIETEREMAPDKYRIRADQVDAATGAVISRVEVPFEREIEVATLKHTGETVNSDAVEVSGSVAAPTTVIIKRGDNLWRISRGLYGKGIRYSTIYRANRDQIRNPNLIYPGQVFVLPTSDTAWEAQQ